MRSMVLVTLVTLFALKLSAQNALSGIELKTLDGGNFSSDDIANEGKPILVLVWELSCKPCLQEFDNIGKVYPQWQKELGVKIVAISVDDNRNYLKVPGQVRSKGWPFEFYQDKNQDIKRGMGATYCPFAFIIDNKNNVIWRKGGYTPGDEAIIYELLTKVAKGEKIPEGE